MAAVDIAPELLEAIMAEFERQMADVPGITEETIASFAEAYSYAERVGGSLSAAFRKNLSSAALPNGRMYYNIAERAVKPAIEAGCELVYNYSEAIQKKLNEYADIGLAVQHAEKNGERIESLINKLVSAEQYDDAAWVLDEPVVNLSYGCVDDTIQENAEFHARTGLPAMITRTAAGGCCDWCAELAGRYEYDITELGEVFRRHDRCRCMVLYNPGDGRGYQNVHTRRWNDPTSYAEIEERKRVERQQKLQLKAYVNGTIGKRISAGEYSTKLSHQQYLKHVEGTAQYEKYASSRSEPQGRLTITEKEAQSIIDRYAGTGMPDVSRSGVIRNVEYVSVVNAGHYQNVGQYYDAASGTWVDTSRIAIHYGKRGAHIVPVEEIKW